MTTRTVLAMVAVGIAMIGALPGAAATHACDPDGGYCGHGGELLNDALCPLIQKVSPTLHHKYCPLFLEN